MTEIELLAIVMSLPEATQSSHFGNPDFRVRNKIFATRPKPDLLNLNLTPEQQQMLVETEGDLHEASQ